MTGEPMRPAIDALRRAQSHHERGRATQRVADEARLLNVDRIHERAIEHPIHLIRDFFIGFIMFIERNKDLPVMGKAHLYT